MLNFKRGKMKKVKELKEERASLIESLQKIDKIADDEKRALTADEQKSWDDVNAKVKSFDEEIVRAEQREQYEKESASREINKRQESKEKREVKNYSFLKAIRMAMDGKLDGKEDGFYIEMHQEAEKEARAAGIKNGISGFGIPGFVVNEKRILTATGTTAVSLDQGGVSIPTELRGFIEYLKDALVVQQLGAQMLTGLQGNISIPRGKTIATAAWEGENDDTDETSPTFESVTASPHRLAAYAQLSKQLIMQSSLPMEAYIQGLLAYAVANKLESAAITGTGLNDIPKGILNTTGIGTVAIAAVGGPPLYTHLLALEKEVDIDNALMGKLGYLMNAKVKAKLKNTKLDAGSGLFLLGQDSKTLNTYPYAVTNLVPSNLTKSTGADLSAMIFGNFEDLIMCQWGGLDITVDSTSLAMAKAGKVGIVINSFWDIIIRHAASFAACVDVDTDLT
jgi:HK97 family phage major capsid protein